MSNENYYNYYLTSPEKCKEMKDLYNNEVYLGRERAIKSLLLETGCEHYTTVKPWGGAEVISGLVIDVKSDILPHHKIINTCKEGTIVRGKLNSKKGKEFQALINSTNNKLKSLPSFKDWLVNEFDVMSSGIAGQHPSGRGLSMISTLSGTVGDRLGFAIPNSACEGIDNDIDIPDCFEQITYGQWFDLTNKGK